MSSAQRPAGITPVQLLRRRLLSGGAWAFSGKVSIALLGLASSALLARLLSPQELGVYFLAYSVVSLCAIIGSVGLPPTVTRFVAQNVGLNRFKTTRQVIGIIFGVGLLGALTIGLVYSLFGGVLVQRLFNSPAFAGVTGLVTGWVVVSILQGLLGETFRGLHDIRLATILGGQVTGTVTGVATVGLFVAALFSLWMLQGQASLATIMLLAVCSGGVITLVAGLLLVRRVAALPRQDERESPKTNRRELLAGVFATAWPILITSVVMFALRNGDLWLVGAYLPQEDVAVYGAAIRLVAMVTMPLIMVNAILPPMIAEMYAQNRREELEGTIRAMTTLTGVPALLAATVCILFAGPILSLVYGSYYREGAVVLALLSVGLLVSVWTGSCGITLQMTGYQKTMMTITIATSILTFAMMLAVVRPYGITGVAVARFIGLAAQNILMWLMVKYRTGMWTHGGIRALPWLLRRMR